MPRRFLGWWIGAAPAPDADRYGVVSEPIRDRFGAEIGRATFDAVLASRAIAHPDRPRGAPTYTWSGDPAEVPTTRDAATTRPLLIVGRRYA